jgi:hypothetical protein
VRLAALALATITALLTATTIPGPRAARRVHPRAAAAADRPALVARLDRAQQIIDDPSSPAAALTGAGRDEQLATVRLAAESRGARRTTLAGLDGPARATMQADLAAAAALAGLVTPHRRLPPWRIIQPPPPDTLLHYSTAAQRRYGVPWPYLAAIEFIETKFGRVAGPSDAGAQGPMQFLPATWAEYGHGNIHDPRAAIPAAARYLAANGAPADMAGALYHYNPSLDYVHAVQDYARRMAADPRAFYGYYQWQVIFAYVRGAVILSVGYPRVRPMQLAASERTWPAGT